MKSWQFVFTGKKFQFHTYRKNEVSLELELQILGCKCDHFNFRPRGNKHRGYCLKNKKGKQVTKIVDGGKVQLFPTTRESLSQGQKFSEFVLFSTTLLFRLSKKTENLCLEYTFYSVNLRQSLTKFLCPLKILTP